MRECSNCFTQYNEVESNAEEKEMYCTAECEEAESNRLKAGNMLYDAMKKNETEAEKENPPIPFSTQGHLNTLKEAGIKFNTSSEKEKKEDVE